MVEKNPEDRRQHKRYDTEVEINFRVSYDLKTKVEYRIADEKSAVGTTEKYQAISKNVSVSGLRFVSEHELEEGIKIFLDVYLPGIAEPVPMEGEVRWSLANPPRSDGTQLYDAGIKIFKVAGDEVDKSIYFDDRYNVEWSIVLENVLGNYRISSQERKSE